MSESYPRENAPEAITFDLTEDDGTPISGANDVTLRVRRVADGFWWDWSDSVFKAGGAVSQLDEAMTEPDATRAPGMYEATWPGGPTADYEAHVLRAGVRVGRALLRVGRLPAPGDAMDLVEGAVDATALDASAVAELQAGMATAAALADVAESMEHVLGHVHGQQEVDTVDGGRLITHREDGSILCTHTLRDGSGNPIALPAGSPARRGPAT